MRTLLAFLQCILISLPAAAVPFEANKFIASGPSPYAIETAKTVHSKGGNAVDMAVAMGLTLSVTSPYFAALGGGGFALIKMGSDEVRALDFREVAPLATNPTFYKDKSSEDGGAAVGVPGFPAGLWEMHKRYGSLPWKTLFEDALRLAEKGFHVSGEWIEDTVDNKERFNSWGRKYLFKADGSNYRPGDLLKQPQLAKALRQFRDQGLSGFYKGAVAQDIADTVQESGGVISVEDMKAYKIRWLSPITTRFKGHLVHMMPPPSSSGVVTKIALGLIERAELEKRPYMSVEEFHGLAEILARSFRGRTLLADPDFHKNPIEFLTSDANLNREYKNINWKKASVATPLSETDVKESSETTHYSLLDKDGNSVALTVTLNGSYGSGVVSKKFGIALNNEMDDFTTRPGQPNQFGLVQGEGNKVEPGKRPLSSMSPTLIEKDGKIVMSLGAPGGPRIISSVLQVIYRVLANGLDVDRAVQTPRVHHQVLPNVLFVDELRFAPETLTALRRMGHTVKESWTAKVYALRKNSKGWLEGAHDSRGEGATGGY